MSDEEKRIVLEFDASERRHMMDNALQLLHLTEFHVLIEYTEVMIPVVFCMYLLAMTHLPNREFYALLNDLSDDELRQDMENILTYAALELLPFLALGWALGRSLGVSSVRQLAFVLERQWPMVQSKLVLWVAIVAQTSLEHFGADYSFQFAWLGSSAKRAT